MQFSQHALEKCDLYGVEPEKLLQALTERADVSRSQQGWQSGTRVRVSGSPLGRSAHP